MRALGLTDGSAGMVAQVRALATAMDVELEEKTIRVNAPWRLLPNIAYDLGLSKIFPVADELIDAPCELIISCGRKAALVSASLRTHAKRIHIQDPQMKLSHFDVVVAMEHDQLSAANVISTPMALHSITSETLARAKERWEPKFAHLPRPWNAVLIGGSTNKYTFSKEAMCALLLQLGEIEGSLLITTSRRTGEANNQLLSDYFLHSKHVFLYTGELENPYLGLLACADKIYVTNDSVNMMSEALASGKPVEILKLQGHKNTKPAYFAERIHNLKVLPQEMMQNLAQSVRQMLATRS